MISRIDFDVLCFFAKANSDKKSIYETIELPRNDINLSIKRLNSMSLLNDMIITEEGLKILDPFKVDNAIIMAAGMSSRFIPFSYEFPKGLTIVKGEVLIERQIEQLIEAGVTSIIIVVGFMLEKFLYLEEKYTDIVQLVVNPEYKTKNNYASLYRVKEYLLNSYICSSDNYYVNNPFKQYEYHSNYCTVYQVGYSRSERGVVCNEEGLIVETNKPSNNQNILIGYAYFDKTFSEAFKPLLNQYYNTPGNESIFWENIYAENLNLLEMYENQCNVDEVLEFDSVEELRAFDENSLMENALPCINNICEVSDIKNKISGPNDIVSFSPLKGGLTNKSFTFEVDHVKYVYRHPGKVSKYFIDRKRELVANRIAKELNIDKSFIYENDEEGWKISYYMKSVEDFDCSNRDHIKALCDELHKLHNYKGVDVGSFDFYNESNRLLELITAINQENLDSISKIKRQIAIINKELVYDEWPMVLCHNDVNAGNCLVIDGKVNLIDWEYSGKSDIGYDLCKLFSMEDIPESQYAQYLSIYYKREPTEKELKHCIGCVAVAYFYWYIWAIYLDINGENMAESILKYRHRLLRHIKLYIEK